MQVKPKAKKPSRSGITLLFTISMLVLFLMMGTAFVIVATNYSRRADRRARHSSLNRDAVAWLDQALYDAVRGPSLQHSLSPLRGHSILEDLYGYGIKGTLSSTASFQPTSNDALVVLQIDLSSLSLIRNGATIENFLSTDSYVDGLFNGRVFTLTTGNGAGYSTRIISHAAVPSEEEDTPDRLMIVIPRDAMGIEWEQVDSGDAFIINGREYSGFGAGQVAEHEIDPDGEPQVRLAPDQDDAGTLLISKATSARPNRVGEPYEDLIAGDGYLSSDKSPNEPWDAPDHHNMFLSGHVGANNDVIPSFHRDRLYSYQYRRSVAALGETGNITASHIRRFTFRPMHIDDNGSTATPPQRPGHSSSQPESWFGRYLEDGIPDPQVALNSEDSLDVDTNMDGEYDAVWIDIGLPDQIDANGFKYRPLVAYRIIDLDGRLNLNAHGLAGDTDQTPPGRSGTGYGVAEISLGQVVNNYSSLLDARYGIDDQPGAGENALTPMFFPTQKLVGHPRINTKTSLRFASAADFFASNVYALPSGDSEAMPEFIATTFGITDHNPYLSDFGLGGGVGDSHFVANELEGILRQGDIDGPLLQGRLDLPVDAAESVTTHSFEIAIPATSLSIIELLRDRIALEFEGEDRKAIFNIFTGNRFVDPNTNNSFEMKYLSKEMLMGGRFNLIPFIGDGVDDDLNGVVDNSSELALGLESSFIPEISTVQFGNPVYDLNNDPETGDATVKQLMAKQLYLLALLTCGETAPEGYPSGLPNDEGVAIGPDELYRQSVAQWAVNVVDFYDTDSTMTVFEYDVNPFNDPRLAANRVDGDPLTDEETERGIVYGAERPEILMTETFAHHDRQNQDTRNEIDMDQADDDPDGDTLDEGDKDWDSARVPQSSLYVELYHPHRQSTSGDDPSQGFKTLPFELSNHRPPTNHPDALRINVKGVNLDILAPDKTPVWRITAHRGPEATNADEHVRTIYFADPFFSKAPDPGHDCFFTTSAQDTIDPNRDNQRYCVVGTDGNVGNGEQTFGRLTSTATDQDPTPGEIARTRAITLARDGVTIRDWDGTRVRSVLKRSCIGMQINQFRKGHAGETGQRGLSLSDPDGGYSVSPADIDGGKKADGVTLKTPNDTPFDAMAASGNRDQQDMEAIWSNGIKQDDDYQFRVLKLQRLADPKANFHEVANPYITIDVANVDLLAFNGMAENPTNEVKPGDPGTDDSTGTQYTLKDFGTTLGGIERGEKIAKDKSPQEARRQLFRALGRNEATDQSGVANNREDHNFSFRFTDGFATAANDNKRHETLGGRNAAYDDTNQYSWMMWNNRPYANKMELANVPMLSAEGIVRHFNRSESETEPIGANETADRAFSHFFGNDQFGHTMAFGSVERDGETKPNRFDWIWEFIEVPNRFLGSETWLATRNSGDEPIFVPETGALKFNLHPPMHSIPNFRYPGKINLNTIYQEDVWNALVRGFGRLDFQTFRDDRETAIGASDFGQHYTTAEAAEFTDDRNALRKGADANLFRSTNTDNRKLTDGFNDDANGLGTDVEATVAFNNELRTRLGIAATTRSNVYAIWITIGYFEVDDLGRVGDEIGSIEGKAQRSRAFYIFDRSIPVASEPGENHNVDNAILTRTIIE